VTTYRFRLYVTPCADSRRAIRNLDRLCHEELEGRYEIEIIDVSVQPALADRDRVLATPTLVKSAPEPVKRVIGDLSDRDKLRASLDLTEVRRTPIQVQVCK
jgi:circadian clock protein KaiB